MDDAAFQEWSDKLSALRNKRQTVNQMLIDEKAASFLPSEFYEGAAASLESILDAWFAFEKKSWEQSPPEDRPTALAAALAEMESTVELEVEAIERDRSTVLSRISWEQEDITEAEPVFKASASDLIKRYTLKLNEFVNGGKKKTSSPPPLPPLPLPKPRTSGGTSRGNGVGLFVMFFVGLIFGGGPSLYFMNASKDSDKKFQEDRSKILADQRALVESMTLMHDNLEQFAKGKGRTIPDLEKEIAEVKSTFIGKRQRVDEEHETARERLLRKIPAGDLQDKAVARLEAERSDKLTAINGQEKSKLSPLVKQIELLMSLLN